MQALRPEDGPSLPLACHLRWPAQLQGFFALPHIPHVLLLGLLCNVCNMGVERDPEQQPVHRIVHAHQRRVTRCAFWDHWDSHYWLHCMASVAHSQGSNNDRELREDTLPVTAQTDDEAQPQRPQLPRRTSQRATEHRRPAARNPCERPSWSD